MGLRRVFFPGKATPAARGGPVRHLGDLRSSNLYWGQASEAIRTTDWLRPAKNLIRWLKWPIIILAIVPLAISYVDPRLAERYMLTLGAMAQAVGDGLLIVLGWLDTIINVIG